MDKKVKIAHIHVWDKKNKGDVGIVLAVQDSLKKIFNRAEIIDLPIEILKQYDAKSLQKINSCDLVVIGGGGIFYHYFLPFDIKLIRAIKIPIIIFGVGYIREEGAKRLDKASTRSLAELVKRAKLVGVRDYYTKQFLGRLGASKDKINLIGDPAIFLAEQATGKIKFKSGVNIGINLNYSGWLGFGKWQDDILTAYSDTIKYFTKNFNARIFYLMHHPDEARILKKLDIPKIEIIDLSAKEQKYCYSQLDLVIGMMLHSCVMAFGAGTPEINVAYDLRNKNFAKFIGCPELVVPLGKLKTSQLLKTASAVLADRAGYQKKFEVVKKRIKKQQDNFLNKLKAIIK